MGTTIEELAIRFSAQTEELTRDLKKLERTTAKSGKRAAKSTDRIQKSLNRVSKAAKSAGGAMVAAFAGGAALRGMREIFSAMNDLQTASEGLGVSVETIQELRFAWLKAGADASKVEKNLTDFIKRIGESRAGLGTLLPFLKTFDIDLNNVNGTVKTSEQLFDEIADIIAGLSDNTARAALGNAAFGRSWVDVVAVLGNGSAALKEVRQQARDTGNVLSKELVKSVAETDAAFNILLLTLGNIAKRGVVTLADFYGAVDITETANEIEARLLKLIKIRDDMLAPKKGVAKFISRDQTDAVASLNQQIVMLQLALANLGVAGSDAVDDVTVSVKNLDKELKENRKDLQGFMAEILTPEKMEAGLKEMDLIISKLQKRTIELGPSSADSINLISGAIEDTIFDLKNADDHVKNLIASFGRLIVQQLALKAATGIVTGIFGFAGGGVMSNSGPMPLKTYSNGGVAHTPQMAVFGEGRKPEAYVPLPDGRSIPVTVKGGGGMTGGGMTVMQENHFGVGIERDVISILMQFAPMLLEASKLANDAAAQGIRT